MSQSATYRIHPEKTPRFYAVFEFEAEDGTRCYFFPSISPESVSEFIEQKPALLIWLPAGAYGEVRAFRHSEPGNADAKYIFEYEIHNSSELGGLKPAKRKSTLESNVMGEDSPICAWVLCASGQEHICCNVGETPGCINGAPGCRQPEEETDGSEN